MYAHDCNGIIGPLLFVFCFLSFVLTSGVMGLFRNVYLNATQPLFKHSTKFPKQTQFYMRLTKKYFITKLIKPILQLLTHIKAEFYQFNFHPIYCLLKQRIICQTNLRDNGLPQRGDESAFCPSTRAYVTKTLGSGLASIPVSDKNVKQMSLV